MQGPNSGPNRKIEWQGWGKWTEPRIPDDRLMRGDNSFCAICCCDGCQIKNKQHVMYQICIIMQLVVHEQNEYSLISLLQRC